MESKKLARLIDETIIKTTLIHTAFDSSTDNINHIIELYNTQINKINYKDYSIIIENYLKDSSFKERFAIDYLCEEIIYIFDMMDENLTKRGTSKEIEFLRHLRNAAMHKNRFNFKEREPKYDAIWKEYKIKKDIEGQIAINNFISIKDTLELLDFIKNKL